ncbi:hypothetical protein L596_009986 [Steinernema carpocapsae]|uniref:Uncharacterized protein n=1 Tax=Steinernema carpocapsae TaxID=34508 RepID=A0A4U5PHG1_STECR|nr:hypothetical protein L596_009986 [Steinernema carpocapsae]
MLRRRLKRTNHLRLLSSPVLVSRLGLNSSIRASSHPDTLQTSSSRPSLLLRHSADRSPSSLLIEFQNRRIRQSQIRQRLQNRMFQNVI